MSREVIVKNLKRAATALVVAAFLVLLWPQQLGGFVAYVMVDGSSMEPGMHTGDLVIVRKERAYEVGDVVAYTIPNGQVGAGSEVIHRIVDGNGQDGFVVQGDNRDHQDQWYPSDGDVVGSRWVLIPGAGRILSKVRAPLPLALFAGLLTTWVVLGFLKKDDEEDEATEPTSSDDILRTAMR
jgi:signal peptidase I